MSEHHKIIIIGAGLSGLYGAWKLQQKQLDVLILEARPRIGGRILTSNQLDMGPAWVWPQLQTRLQQLLLDLKLNVFPQYTHGTILYEKSANQKERYHAPSAHQNSYRIEGGAECLINALRSQLSETQVHLNTIVNSIDELNLCVHTLRDGKAFVYTADKIILALPPRLFLQNIEFSPDFSNQQKSELENISTWMAGHSKMLFIYEKPFWRDKKLSGEVFSHHGPLSEIYDGSPVDESFYALTAFVGLSAQQRKQIAPEQLLNACMAQLQRLFGDESAKVKDVQIQDWSQEIFTTSVVDLTSPAQHPQYPENIPRAFWDGNLILAGTEAAREHGGYLEGALESADEAIGLL